MKKIIVIEIRLNSKYMKNIFIVFLLFFLSVSCSNKTDEEKIIQELNEVYLKPDFKSDVFILKQKVNYNHAFCLDVPMEKGGSLRRIFIDNICFNIKTTNKDLYLKETWNPKMFDDYNFIDKQDLSNSQLWSKNVFELSKIYFDEKKEYAFINVNCNSYILFKKNGNLDWKLLYVFK